jgi:PEP-CTERM motif-containing protein
MRLQALSFDDTAGSILSVQYAGGFQLVPEDENFTTGGSLAITNLRLDLVEKRIYASVLGANGVGSLDNVALWTTGSISGTTVVPSESLIHLADGSGRVILDATLFDTRFSGIKLTDQGTALWKQSMGYVELGPKALESVTSFGDITTSAVPEPSAYALLMGGMMVLSGLAIRRQRQNVH